MSLLLWILVIFLVLALLGGTHRGVVSGPWNLLWLLVIVLVVVAVVNGVG